MLSLIYVITGGLSLLATVFFVLNRLYTSNTLSLGGVLTGVLSCLALFTIVERSLILLGLLER